MHGIPSRKRVLREGDVVSLDCGVKFEGMYTDSALTVAVGEIAPAEARLPLPWAGDPYPSTYHRYPGVPTLLTNVTVYDGEGARGEQGDDDGGA